MDMLTEDELQQLEYDICNISYLTDSQSKKFASEIVKTIRTLQQQNAQMKEALGGAKAYLELSPSWNEKKYRVYHSIEQAIEGGTSNE